MNQRDSCTVRMSNLSPYVNDQALHELFGRFGAIQRIYLAKDRETHTSRGFAFINFFSHDDAQRAIDELHGVFPHGRSSTGHLVSDGILSVTWSNPSAQAPQQQAPPTGADFGPALGAGAPCFGAGEGTTLKTPDHIEEVD